MTRPTPLVCILFLASLLSLALFGALAPTARAQTFTVTKTDDTNDGNCDEDCSLREAIIAANQNAGPDTIVLGPGVYRLTIAGWGEDMGATGDLDIRDDTILQGSGAEQTIIDAGDFPSENRDRVLHILYRYPGPNPDNPIEILSAFTPTVTIENVTIMDGYGQSGSKLGCGGCGGGIHSEGTLTLRNSRIISNSTLGIGGGLYQAEIDHGDTVDSPPLLIENSLIAGNTAQYGGGIGTGNGATVTIVGSIIEDNVGSGTAVVLGGGLYSAGEITLTNTTVRNNRLHRLEGTIYGCGVGDGGGIYIFYGRLSLQNSQVISNSIRSDEKGCSTPSGGGIYAGELYLTNTQVLSNVAASGGGIRSGGSGRIENSTIAYNRAESFNPDSIDDGAYGGLYIGAGYPLTIVNSEITHNYAASDGGGLYSFGGAGAGPPQLTIEDSLIGYNQAEGVGGGLIGDVNLTRSTVRGNRASYGAGVVLNSANVRESLIVDNRASEQAGAMMTVFVGLDQPSINVVNSTFSGNEAPTAGAIDSLTWRKVSESVRIAQMPRSEHWNGAVNFLNVTIADNRSNGSNAGIYDSDNGIVFTVENTLIANNDGDNCTNLPSDATKGYNLSDDGTCLFTATGDLTKIDPKLGPLQDNSGSTLTHALLDGSPAIDAGGDTHCPATDQRGVTRPRGPRCDIGAYEYVIDKPILKVTPNALTFVGVAGSSSPADQILQVLDDGVGGFTWTATESIDWLTLNAASGSADTEVSVSVDSSGLGVGTYTGEITFGASNEDSNVLESPQTVQVTLQMIDASELLQNGDFEKGRTGWNESSATGRALIRQNGDVPHTTPHSGSWAAVLGQVDGETSELSQEMTLPSGDDLYLHYYAYLHSTENSCTIEIAEVWIGDTKVKEHPLCQSQNSSNWTQHTLDLNAYRGQKVNVRFKLRNDAISDPSTFLLDDVRLQLGDGQPTATPTVTSNFSDGAPGSYFTIRAENFPPNAQAKILVNGTQVGTGQTDANGVLQVELDTTSADEGIYILTVQVNPTATYTLRLDAAAPVRSKQESGALLTVPSGIALTSRLYLPGVSR